MCSPRLRLFDKKYSNKSNIVKYYSNNCFYFFYLTVFNQNVTETGPNHDTDRSSV